MKTLIIEDELPAANKLSKLLQAIDPAITVLPVCRTVEDSVQWLNSNPVPDIIFMDIELADGQSFEIFEQVNITSPVVFVTAYNEYAIRAIKLRAFDYLLKPVTKEGLIGAITSVKQHLETYTMPRDFSDLQKLLTDISAGKRPKRLAVNARDGISFLDIDTISHLHADSNYSHIHLCDGKKITVSKTLKEYEDLLAPYGFLRVHNSHLINLHLIQKYVRDDGGYVVMQDGTSIEISQSRKKDLLKALMIE